MVTAPVENVLDRSTACDVDTRLHALNVELGDRPQYVAWKYEQRGKPKPTKVPYRADGSGLKAASDNPATWTTFEQAMSNRNGFDGIGFVLTDRDDFVGIDLDKCLVDGQVEPWAQAIVDGLDSYTEISPSGSGLRVFLHGTKPGAKCRNDGIECYENKRFLTLTGNRLPEARTTVEHRQVALREFYRATFDKPENKSSESAPTPSPSSSAPLVATHHSLHQIYDAIRKIGNADLAQLLAGKIPARHASTSEAVGGLVHHLAWYTQDAAQIDTIFRGSEMYGDGENQWGEKWSRLGAKEIDDALAAQAGKGYDWTHMDHPVKSAAAADGAEGPPAATGFDALIESGTDWRNRAGVEPEMVIPGVLVTKGFALVGGGAKEGKTWALIDMICSVANDKPFMGIEIATPGPVLVIPAEGSHAGTAARFDMLARGKGLDPDRAMAHIDMLFRKNVMLDDPAFIEYLKSFAHKYVMIVADPLVKLWCGDEDKAKDVGPFTRTLSEIAERGPAFVLSHHTVKVSENSRNRNPWLNIRGSGQWYGALDSGLYVERGKGATRTTVQFAGKDYSPAPTATFTWPAVQSHATDAIDLDWECSQGGPGLTGLEQQEREALRVVTERPWLSRRQLRDLLPGDTMTRPIAIDNLLARGVLELRKTSGKDKRGRRYTYDGLHIPGTDSPTVQDVASTLGIDPVAAQGSSGRGTGPNQDHAGPR